MIARQHRPPREGGEHLVCADCGQPQHIASDPQVRWRRLTNLGMLLALVFAGGVLFVTVTLLDATDPSLEPERPERGYER